MPRYEPHRKIPAGAKAAQARRQTIRQAREVEDDEGYPPACTDPGGHSWVCQDVSRGAINELLHHPDEGALDRTLAQSILGTTDVDTLASRVEGLNKELGTIMLVTESAYRKAASREAHPLAPAADRVRGRRRHRRRPRRPYRGVQRLQGFRAKRRHR